ncbi:VirK/YbjX family protein [Cronobacter sakazakii]|nr:VirK/YbjX family protein [Cronobacter sakazakii]MDI7562909.1 VirK/YbjX family protein [Cronobacter sakazakii]MDI7567774.1 VirK/YbjX family protein [Cronobacter sakazakii]MDI7572046.1 VirK/YbjX family protein [Cronobacter sakazakii]MDI7574764.1 VirK/YbjX family protein [Cronobacter sakazakii]
MSALAEISIQPPAHSAWQLFRLLATGQKTPGLAWENPAYRRKFMLRSLATPFATRRWLSVLARQPMLDALLHAQPGLPCRLHRPWLSVNVSRKAALAALEYHYQHIERLLPDTLMQGHLTRQGSTLATLSGKNDAQYRLDLAAIADLDKEGETTMIFRDANGVVLAEMTFTLCEVDGQSALFIGGLQGAKAWVEHDQIQLATKACHGLFPKRLLLEAVCLLAQHFGVSQILAVSNETHIYRSWRYAKKKKDKLHADYDSFWESLGGEKDARGLYHMPLQVARKSLEEIASKKRAEYRRRYEFLDSMTAQINARFDER